jgi:hypothetical protein
MAIAKTRTDLIGTSVSKTTITAGSSSTSASKDCSTFVGIQIGGGIDFGGTPDDDVLVEVLSSPDDTNFDTIAMPPFKIGFLASSTVQKTIRIGPEDKYLKVKTTNEDSTDSIDAWLFLMGMTT